MRGLDPLAGAPAPNAEAAKGKPASPEEQAEYNKFVGMALMALTDEGFYPKLEKTLKDHPDPTNAMAEVGMAVASRIVDAAMQQGQPVSPSIILHGGREIMDKIGEMAGYLRDDIEPEEVEDAYYQAADMMHKHLGKTGANRNGGPYEIADMDAFMAEIGEEPVRHVQNRMQAANQRSTQRFMKGAGA